MWEDHSTIPLVSKLQMAANHYHSKYGAWPNFCYVHPSERTLEYAAGMEVQMKREVRRGCYWIGVKEDAGA